MIIPLGFFGQETTSSDNYYAFDASTTDYFTTTYDLNGLSDFSIVAKARFNDTSTDRCLTGGTISSTQMQFRLDATNTFNISFNDGVNFTSETYDWSVGFDTLWHTFIVTYEYLTTTAEIKFYIDGVQFGTTYTDTTSPFTGWSASRLFQVGRRGTNTGIMNGDISHVQLYSDVLTGAEVTTLQGNVDGVSGNKVLDLNQTKSSTIWTDNSAGSNDGTNGGGAVYVP